MEALRKPVKRSNSEVSIARGLLRVEAEREGHRTSQSEVSIVRSCTTSLKTIARLEQRLVDVSQAFEGAARAKRQEDVIVRGRRPTVYSPQRKRVEDKQVRI